MATQTSDPFSNLASALRERLSVIADRQAYTENPEAHMNRLKAASERITDAATKLPQPVPPELSHYLQRASYDKALAWLESHLR